MDSKPCLTYFLTSLDDKHRETPANDSKIPFPGPYWQTSHLSLALDLEVNDVDKP